jgi:hypothetical protein
VYAYGATASSTILDQLTDIRLVLLASFALHAEIGCLVITICPIMVHGNLEVQRAVVVLLKLSLSVED